MNPRVISKNVPIGDKIYQISKMDARLACWLFATLAARAENGLMSSLGKLTRVEFDEIQGFALKFISLLETQDGLDLLTPVISGDGRWSSQDLIHNPEIVFKLMTECILFNVEPFLEKEPLK